MIVCEFTVYCDDCWLECASETTPEAARRTAQERGWDCSQRNRHYCPEHARQRRLATVPLGPPAAIAREG